MNKKMKIIVIGCGRMGAFTSELMKKYGPKCWMPLNHVEAIKGLTKYYLLDSICDIDHDNVQRAAKVYGIGRIYTDYETAISESSPDVVSIATRTDIKHQIMLFSALNNVKGVHCEKPLARSVGECEKGINIMSENKIKISYGTYRRYMPIYQRVKQMLNNGEIGRVIQILIEHGLSKLMWSHPHSVDLLIYLAGSIPVESVQADCVINDYDNNMIINDDPIVKYSYVSFNNGISGIITSGGGMNVKIFGEKGSISVVSNGEYILLEKSRGNSPYYRSLKEIKMHSIVSGTQGALSELYKDIYGMPNNNITYDELLLQQKILMAIPYSSLNGGRRITLNEVPKSFTVNGIYQGKYA